MRNLNIHSLRDSVNRLCDFLDNEYDINNGGCCFIAALLAKHFDRLGISYNLIVYDYFKKDLDQIQYEVSNKVKNKSLHKSITSNHTCNHYCLSIEGAGEINSTGFDDDEFKYTIKNVYSSNIQWIYKHGKWNDAYDVNNNEVIKGIINSFFKRYEETLFVN